MKIYELMFYEDSPKDIPMICKMQRENLIELEYGKLMPKDYTIKLEVVQQGEKDNFIKCTDCSLIVDIRTKEEIKRIADKDVEFIPCSGLDEQIYAVNILNVLEGTLNRDKSLFSVMPDDFPVVSMRGKIGAIWDPVLYQDRIEGHIFRISEFQSYVFVDDIFKQMVDKNGFTGIGFERVKLS